MPPNRSSTAHNEAIRVRVGDVSLYVETEGSRPAVVLLHGGPGADHTLFQPEASTLADLAQLVYVDQRGSGRSDAGAPSQWTWNRWANDISTLCEALGIAQPILLGASSGAVVAMAYAAGREAGYRRIPCGTATSSGRRSGRSPRHDGWRSRPSGVRFR